MSNAFEYGDALLPRPEGADENAPTPEIETNQPYLSLATFRMVVLADEVLESFFETDLSASFRLEPVPLMELPPSNSGFLGGLWSNIATDTNVKLFHKFSDEVGKSIGRHQVIHRPSIGRYTSIEDTRPRESLLMRPSSSGTTSAAETSSTTTTEESRDLADTHKLPLPLDPMSPGGVDPLAQATIAANALMERTPFAIDGPGDDDDDDDDEDDEEEDEEAEYDDDVLDEVRLIFAFLEGGTRADRSFVCFCRWMLSSRRMTRASRMQTRRSRTVGETCS
jgi:hypothetical protein